MDTHVADYCTKASLDQDLPFPEVVRRLLDAGVDGYFTDLVLKQKTYYGTMGETHIVSMAFDGPSVIPERFNANAVTSALRSAQQQELRYRQFLQQIMEAGTWSYHVFLRGRRAIYLGRMGEFHVERFPDGWMQLGKSVHAYSD